LFQNDIDDLRLTSNVYFDGSFRYVRSGTATIFHSSNGSYKWNIAASGTAGNAITFTQAMTLDASGNLSLSKISFNSDSPFYTGANINSGNNQLGIGATGATVVGFFTNSSERMRITSGGDALIGTTSSILSGTNNRVLDINGTSSTYIGFSTSSQLRGYIYADASGAGIGSYTNVPFTFITNNTERMRITSGGELLINTTSDAGDYKLQVNGAMYLATVNGANNSIVTDYTSSYTPLRSQLSGARSWQIDNVSGNFKIYIDGTLDAYALELNQSGNLIIPVGSIKTAAPSGGTAKPYKLGEAGVAIGGSDGYAVKVEIDGTLYYLMTGYLPEPAPEAQAGPSSGYKAQFEQPVIKIKSDNQKIKDLEKEIAELKELIKTKIK